MDIWGTGCVLFEILSLFPLFPGNNELDQVHKIHNILGTPPQHVLDNFQKHATHMDFDFSQKEGTGIAQLIPHVSPECQDLIIKLLAYVPDDRLTAKQALKHPCFSEFRNQDKKSITAMPGVMPQPDENSDDELKQAKKTGKIGMMAATGDPGVMSEYQKSLKKVQQGSNKGSEMKLLTDKHNISADSDEPSVPTNVFLMYI